MEFPAFLGYVLLHCLLLNGGLSEPRVQADRWRVQVPGTVSALQGSCVVVPCTFTYPGRERKRLTFAGMWLTKDGVFVYHPDAEEVARRFRGRTSLAGDLGRSDCSLKIDHVQQNDGGPFIFRVVIDGVEKFSYTKSEVSIAVKSHPDVPSLALGEAVKAGGVVSASCFVHHSCPSNPPVLSWNRAGSHSVHSEKLPGGQWRTESVLRFASSPSDHKKPLVCTAKYWGGKTARSSKPLNIKYAPRNVRVEFGPRVKEGESVELWCSGDSNPAAHVFRWFDATGALLAEGVSYTLLNVSRHTGTFYCTATNSEGQGSSSPVHVPVEYPPEIKAGSGCAVNSSGVNCLCAVDSVPASEVTWLLSEDFLTSSWTEVDGSVTLCSLRAARGLFHTISCQATNVHGSVTATFGVPSRGKLLYVAVPVCVALGAAAAVLLWAVMRSRESSETPATQLTDAGPKDIASCSAPSRKEAGFIPTSRPEGGAAQHVYGNVGVRVSHAAGEEVIYENL